jgi:hypothetical protein
MFKCVMYNKNVVQKPVSMKSGIRLFDYGLTKILRELVRGKKQVNWVFCVVRENYEEV